MFAGAPATVVAMVLAGQARPAWQALTHRTALLPALLQVLQRISGAFKPGSAVIARSSANVEDLAGMSGEQPKLHCLAARILRTKRGAGLPTWMSWRAGS